MVGVLVLLAVIAAGYRLLAWFAERVFERADAEARDDEPEFWQIVQ